MADALAGQFQNGVTFGTGTVVTGVTAAGTTAGTKADTRLYVLTSDVTSDLSQRGLTLSGSGQVAATNSLLLRLDAPRTIEAEFEANNTASGTIACWADTSGVGAWQIRIDGSGNIEFRSEISAAMTTIRSEALPEVDGTSRTYWVKWSSEIDPDQDRENGATTTYLHDIVIYTDDPGSATFVQFSQANHTAAGADFFVTGAYFNGISASDAYDDTLTMVRVSNRAHSPSEFFRDWINIGETYTEGDAIVRDPLLPLGSIVVADGQMAGPYYAHAGAMVRQCAQRTLSPLVNLLPNEAPVMLNTYLPIERWAEVSLGGTTYTTPLGLLWHVPVPPMANRLRVSLHMQVYDGVGSSNQTVTAAMVSSNYRPGVLGTLGGAPLERYYTTGSRTVDDTSSGLGDWVTFGSDIRIARDSQGWTWLYVAFVAADSDSRWKVWAVSFDPVEYDAGGESLPLEFGP